MKYKAYVYLTDGSRYETIVDADTRATAEALAGGEVSGLQASVAEHRMYDMFDNDTKWFASSDFSVEVYEADPAYIADPEYVAQFPRMRLGEAGDWQRLGIEKRATGKHVWWGVARYDAATGERLGWFTNERHGEQDAYALAAHYQKFSPRHFDGRAMRYVAEPIDEKY